MQTYRDLFPSSSGNKALYAYSHRNLSNCCGLKDNELIHMNMKLIFFLKLYLAICSRSLLTVKVFPEVTFTEASLRLSTRPDNRDSRNKGYSVLLETLINKFTALKLR